MAALAREAYRSIEFEPRLRQLVKVRAAQLTHCAQGLSR
jgi:hypothetical protein